MSTSLVIWRQIVAARRVYLTFALLGALVTTPLAAGEPPFVTLYPGNYGAREQALVRQYFADNAALEARGPIDVAALVAGKLPSGTPGVGPVIHVTADMIHYYARRDDPDNPLRNDAAYARAAGYVDIPAYPTFGTNDDTFMAPWPARSRDKLLVSQLNHSVTTYEPVYAGDTLYLVTNSRHVTDMTPSAGSTYRDIAIVSNGSVFNQHGHKINDVTFRVMENVRILHDGVAPESPGFRDIWIGPPWQEHRPAHRYTDQDWRRIIAIWAGERRQGATPRYWEDVRVGDHPSWTLDGPLITSVLPVRPWGMGLGGNRTLKTEISNPQSRAKLRRSVVDGIYRHARREDDIPSPPDSAFVADVGPDGKAAFDTTDIHKDTAGRSALVNYMARDFAIRHLSNWMGDQGWLETMRWGIMGPHAIGLQGYSVPAIPDAEDFLAEVPELKGRTVVTHGLTGDVAIIKSVVTAKYVRDGRFLVDLVWWAETIDAQIFEHGRATVRLPSREVNAGQGMAGPDAATSDAASPVIDSVSYTGIR